MASSAASRIGQTVGNYTLRAILGRGGMATVYRAEHRFLGDAVAVKVLHSSSAANERLVQRFFQEARTTRALEHPNIVRILDFGQDETEGALYLVMELLDGRSLASALEEEGRLAELPAALIGATIADALTTAHARGVVHRDLKPDNIFLCKGGTVKLLDFGIAKAVEDSPFASQPSLVGTPQYMAPEQARQERDVGPAADTYSLGVVLYRMVTGRLPFEAENVATLIIRHLSDPPPPPSRFAPVSRHLEALILGCLEKLPERRPRSMVDVRDRLAAIVEGTQHGGETSEWSEVPTALDVEALASESPLAEMIDASVREEPTDSGQTPMAELVRKLAVPASTSASTSFDGPGSRTQPGAPSPLAGRALSLADDDATQVAQGPGPALPRPVSPPPRGTATGDSPTGTELVRPPPARPSPSRGGRTWLFVVLAVGLLGVAGAVVTALVLQSRSQQGMTVTEIAVPAVAPPTPPPAAQPAAPKQETPEPPGGSVATAEQASAPPVEDPAARTAPKPVAKEEPPAPPEPLADEPRGHKRTHRAPATTPAAPPARTLASDELERCIDRVHDRLGTCHDRYGVDGTSRITVVVDGGGTVANAVVEGAFTGTPTGICVASIVRTCRFDPFSGPPQSVSARFELK